MFRTSLSVAGVALSCTLASAQQALPLPSPPKHAGVLHLDYDWWERPTDENPDPGSTLGSVIYSNDAPQPYFLQMAQTKFEYGDYGRVPGPTSPEPEVGTRASYKVTGFEFSYCTDRPRGEFQYVLRFYSPYRPCSPGFNADATLRVLALEDLPGAPAAGQYAAWTVTVDLRSGDEFCLDADGRQGFQNDVVLDSFGFSLKTNDANATGGVVLAGDPTGTYGPAAPYGDGTVWHENEGEPGTGLGTEDTYFKRGKNQHYCAQVLNAPAYSSFHMKIYADLEAPPCGTTFQNSLGTTYCHPATPNSSGRPGAVIVSGSDVVADNELMLWALELPITPNPGLFLLGNTQDIVHPPGSAGPLCVGGQIVRLPLDSTGQLPGGFRRTLDLTGNHGSVITAGSTWNFQAWYRDGMGPSNLTNAVSVPFQ